MANRRRDRESLLTLLSRLPWWLCVALAVVSYLLLSAVAARPMPTKGPGVPLASLWIAGARALQWLAPLVFLGGALLSVIGRRERAKLLVAGRTGGTEAAERMTWQEFELLIGEAFRRQGYTVTELGGPGPDGGVDLLLRKGSERAVVQCKQWRAFKVGLPVVRELLGAMTAERAARGWVVTSGRFTAEAEAFADKHGIMLIDGMALPALLGSSTDLRREPKLAPDPAEAPGRPVPSATVPEVTPQCPACGKAMVRRQARRGAQAGEYFWGCGGYPACRGTRRMAG